MTDAHAPREWDATAYDALPLPHERWGRDLIAGLELRGDETVLEAGAGTGRDAALLLDRLPDGRYIGVDGSAAMLERLRDRHSGDPRVRAIHADLREPLPTDIGPVDIVLSIATFHWLPDLAATLGHLAAAMAPGGLLQAECGGAGQLAAVDAAARAEGLETIDATRTFRDADQAMAALRAAGFVDVQARLVPDPLVIDDLDVLARYLVVVNLNAQLADLAPDQQHEVARRVAVRLPGGVVDYVRLQLSGRRP